MSKVIRSIRFFFIKEGGVFLGYDVKRQRWDGLSIGVTWGIVTDDEAVKELNKRGISILPGGLRKVAVIDCDNSQNTITCRAHAYLIDRWEGIPRASDFSVDRLWFPCDNLPVSELAPIDVDWLPKAMQGKTVYSRIHLREDKSLKTVTREVDLEYLERYC